MTNRYEGVTNRGQRRKDVEKKEIKIAEVPQNRHITSPSEAASHFHRKHVHVSAQSVSKVIFSLTPPPPPQLIISPLKVDCCCHGDTIPVILQAKLMGCRISTLSTPFCSSRGSGRPSDLDHGLDTGQHRN